MLKASIVALFLILFCGALIPQAQANPYTLTNSHYFTSIGNAYIYFPSSVLPQTFSDWYYDGVTHRNYFNSTVWITTTRTMTIASWFTNNWLNYTLAGSGIQQIFGSKPTSVYIDGFLCPEESGWRYSTGVLFITGATTSVWINWLSFFIVVITPSTTAISLGQSILFTSSIEEGGLPPYFYQWYLNETAVSGANNPTWRFIPTHLGTYEVYLIVIDGERLEMASNMVRLGNDPKNNDVKNAAFNFPYWIVDFFIALLLFFIVLLILIFQYGRRKE